MSDKLEPNLIYLLRFSSNGKEKEYCCTSESYLSKIETFIKEFKREKELIITISIIKKVGKCQIHTMNTVP